MKQSISPLLACILLGTILTGCRSKAPDVTESVSVTTAAMETVPIETAPLETTQPEPSIPETTASSDTAARLAEVEAEYTALLEKLINDGSLTQADMNDLSGQQYTLWDTLLNELWVQLTATLPDGQMQELLREERAWIRWKENSVALAANYYDGGSLSVLAANQRAARLTRDRVYELADMLTGQTSSQQAGTDLYRQVFLTLISQGQRPSYENLQLLLDFRGFTLQEEEGTFQIPDPQLPGGYLCGSLSNDTGTVTIPQLIYSIGDGSSQRAVRVAFFTESTDFYIDAAGWDEGTLVSSPEELTAYLQAAD